MNIWSKIFPPRRVDEQEVIDAESEYDSAFKKWCAASHSEEQLHYNQVLDLAALKMNRIKKKRKRWLDYNGGKG